MEKEHLILLADYNRKANNSMNEILKTLNEEQWRKEYSGFYKSIPDICSHIAYWDFNGFNRCNYLHKFTSLEEKFTGYEKFEIHSLKISDNHKEYLNKDLISSKYLFENSSIDEYINTRIILDNRIINFIEELTKDDLEKIIEFIGINGKIFKWKLDVFIIHLFNHQTHHRGMISLYLDMVGKENDYSNLIFYYNNV